jgi:hypothetical protein
LILQLAAKRFYVLRRSFRMRRPRRMKRGRCSACTM